MITKRIKEHREAIFIGVTTMLVILIGVFYFAASAYYQNRSRLVKVSGFNYIEIGPDNNTCQALSAECGYCPGEIIEKECWVRVK